MAGFIEALARFPEVIKAVAGDPVALAALMALIIATVALAMFPSGSKVGARVGALCGVIIAMLVLIFAVLPPPRPDCGQVAAQVQSLKTSPWQWSVRGADGGQYECRWNGRDVGPVNCTEGGNALGNTDACSGNRPHLYLPHFCASKYARDIPKLVVSAECSRPQ